VRGLRAIVHICTVRSVPHRTRAPHLGREGTVPFAVILVVSVATLSMFAAATPAFASNGSALPAVTAIWPRSGPVNGGTSLTVVGSGFTGATAVSVAGVATNVFTVVSDTVVHVTAPASAAGSAATGAVVVTTPAGNSAATALNTFAYRTGGTSIMVPSYIYPGAGWSQIDAGHPPVDLAIINPASGPGSSPDTNYASQVQTSQGAGVDVVGYVHTSYGTRSLGTVENEISEYETWYHVNGIFVDEASTNCSTESSYYAPLYAYIHAQPGLDLTILNPGTATNQCYMAASDVILGFEGSPTDLAGAGPLPSWTANYPPGRFWGVVYGTSSAALGSVLSTLSGDGFGEVYVTDQNLPNPYGALPTYWDQELTDSSGPASGPPPIPQTVTFTTTPPAVASVGATYPVAAVGGPSGQPVVLSVDPAATSVCALVRSTVTFGAAGSCVIDANQAGTATYAPAPQAQQVITVSSAPVGSPPTITSPSNATVPAGQSFSVTVSATGNPAPTINISGNLPRGVSVSGGANGTATISGTSRRSRTYSLSITATNATGTASQTFTLAFS